MRALEVEREDVGVVVSVFAIAALDIDADAFVKVSPQAERQSVVGDLPRERMLKAQATGSLFLEKVFSHRGCDGARRQ